MFNIFKFLSIKYCLLNLEASIVIVPIIDYWLFLAFIDDSS